jgi:hypothetical protein
MKSGRLHPRYSTADALTKAKLLCPGSKPASQSDGWVAAPATWYQVTKLQAHEHDRAQRQRESNKARRTMHLG